MSDNPNPNPNPDNSKEKTMSENHYKIWLVCESGYKHWRQHFFGTEKAAQKVADGLAQEIMRDFDSISEYKGKVEKILFPFTMEGIGKMALLLWSENNIKSLEVSESGDIVHVERHVNPWTYGNPCDIGYQPLIGPRMETIVLKNASEDWIKVIGFLNWMSKDQNAYDQMLEWSFPRVNRPEFFISNYRLPDLEMTEDAQRALEIFLDENGRLKPVDFGDDDIDCYYSTIEELFVEEEQEEVKEILLMVHLEYYSEFALKHFMKRVKTFHKNESVLAEYADDVIPF